MITAYYHPGFAAPLGERHVMPIRKFALVADALRAGPLAKHVRLVEPAPLAYEDVIAVHNPHYVEAVHTGRPTELAESQKFPWSPQLYPSVLLTGGGCLAAARTALDSGVAAALASGFHHAHADRGEGFCTFNSLVITIDKLWHEKRIRTAAVLDCDLHYGNGTALLAATRPYLRAYSVYGNDYWDNTAYRDVSTRRHEDGPNHKSSRICHVVP